jgi:hypothetical protein
MKPCSVCGQEVVVHEKEVAERASGRQLRTVDAIPDDLHASMQKDEQ